MNVLPENDTERGAILLATCLLDYFPNACAAVARHSAKSNDKHNPGEPPHWARDKSTDHRNKIARHLVDAGGFDNDGNRHSVAIAWRGLALLEDELIAEGAMPGRNAVGSPVSTARKLYDETSAIAAAQDAAQDIVWNTRFPTRAQLDAGIPAESAYLASFGPNDDISAKFPKADSRIITSPERVSLRKVLTPAQCRAYGIGDAEPATLRDIPDSFTDSRGYRITRWPVACSLHLYETTATSQHPMAAEALRYADELPEDRL